MSSFVQEPQCDRDGQSALQILRANTEACQKAHLDNKEPF